MTVKGTGKEKVKCFLVSCSGFVTVYAKYWISNGDPCWSWVYKLLRISTYLNTACSSLA